MSCIVNAACEKLFARAGFTGQKQRAEGSRRDAAGHVHGVPHTRALGDDRRELVTAISRGGKLSLKGWRCHGNGPLRKGSARMVYSILRPQGTVYSSIGTGTDQQHRFFRLLCSLRRTRERNAKNSEPFRDTVEPECFDFRTDLIDQGEQRIRRTTQ
jgi:hypothetical protein